MSAEVLKIEPAPEKKVEKVIKPRVELINAGMIIESWKLLEQSYHENKWPYPDLTETTPQQVRSFLFWYLSQPTFMGVMVKVGRKPVGQIIGHFEIRPFGSPRAFWSIWNLYVDPEYRGKGIAKLLVESSTDEMKKRGVFHWEAHVFDELAGKLLTQKLVPCQRLHVRIGGKR